MSTPFGHPLKSRFSRELLWPGGLLQETAALRETDGGGHMDCDGVDVEFFLAVKSSFSLDVAIEGNFG